MSYLTIRCSIRIIAILVVPIILFSIISIIPGIQSINQLISNSGINLAFIFISLVLFTLAYKRKDWLKYLYTTGLLTIFYGLLLKWFWTTGYSEGGTQIWGYLPTSDCITYYQEAYGILLGNPLNGSATFRPISTLFFSSLLWITNLNPMMLLWIVVYLNIMGSLIASNEVWKTHGALAAAVYLTAGLLFYKYTIGTLMTEQLGFLLGNLAFACFWNGIATKTYKKVFLGLFILSLGLNVRAGAMFILLTLSIWIGFFCGEKKFSLKWGSISLLIALSGFVINTLVVKVFTPDNGTMFSNFGFTLYGVAVGNKGWYQIVRDHPGVTTAESTHIAIQQIISNPSLFLHGVFKTYLDYFNPSTCWAYCYLQLKPTINDIVVLVFSLVGGGYVIKNRKNALSKFLIFSLVGIFFSIPFAPTRDVGQRSYTITNPILTSLLFIGFPWFKQLVGRISHIRLEPHAPDADMTDESSERIFSLTYPLITVVLLLSLVIPFFTYAKKPLLQSPSQQICAEDEIKIEFFTNSNAWIHVVSQENLPQGISIPYATVDTLTRLVTESPYHLKRSFSNSVQYAKPGNSVGYAPFYYSGFSQKPNFTLVMVVMNSSDLPKNMGLVQLCGRNVTTKGTESNYIKTFLATNLNEN